MLGKAVCQRFKLQHASMLLIASKMLFNSQKKFIGMLIGATFSAFIIMQQPGIYQGVSDRLVAQLRSIKQADLWVLSHESSAFDDPTYFKSMDIYRVQSVPGVKSVVQIYRSWYSLEHLKTHKKMSWELIAVDPKTLIGLPEKMLAGSRDSIRHSNAIIIDGYALKQFETAAKKTIQLGDELFDGQRTFIVTGITKPLRTYMYQPKFYMLSSHIPNVANRPSFILVKVNPADNINDVARKIHAITQYDALTPKEFSERALTFFQKKTPIIIIFISVAVLGFIIGLILMWQIFSNFTLTHLHQFGMLKMLGVSNSILIKMVFFQAAITGGGGYLLGLLLTLLFGIIFYDTTVAFHLTWSIACLGALGTLFIILLASYFSVLKVLRLDTVDLCRDVN